MSRRAFLFAIPVLAAVRATRVPADVAAFIRKVPPCDTCGVIPGLDDWRGWTLARDEHEIEPVDGCEAFNLGALKVGCGAHPVKSITYRREI